MEGERGGRGLIWAFLQTSRTDTAVCGCRCRWLWCWGCVVGVGSYLYSAVAVVCSGALAWAAASAIAALQAREYDHARRVTVASALVAWVSFAFNGQCGLWAPNMFLFRERG